MNTDAQALQLSAAGSRIQIGTKLTKGLGGGPGRGRRAGGRGEPRGPRGQRQGADMVFVTAGMGGGASTGAAPCRADRAGRRGADDRRRDGRFVFENASLALGRLGAQGAWRGR
ncbi:MAG: hypothetical protein U0470_14235 [Anaerolineae bacterium]